MIIIMSAADGVAVGGLKPPFIIHSTSVVSIKARPLLGFAFYEWEAGPTNEQGGLEGEKGGVCIRALIHLKLLSCRRRLVVPQVAWRPLNFFMLNCLTWYFDACLSSYIYQNRPGIVIYNVLCNYILCVIAVKLLHTIGRPIYVKETVQPSQGWFGSATKEEVNHKGKTKREVEGSKVYRTIILDELAGDLNLMYLFYE